MRDKSALGRARGSDYVQGLTQQWRLVAVALVVGLAAALAYLHWAPREFRSQTSVLVTATPDGTTPAARNAATVNLDTEAQLVKATSTVLAASDKLKAATGVGGPRGLGARVEVTVPPNTDVLNIAFTGTAPRRAQLGSLAFAEAYLDQRRASMQASLDTQDKALQGRLDAVNAQLQGVIQARAKQSPGSPERALSDAQVTTLNNQIAALATGQNQLRAVIVSPGQIVKQPVVPTAPSSPNRLVTLSAGIALGLLAGVGIVAVRRRWDDRIHTAQDLSRSTDLPVGAVLSDSLQPGEVTFVPPLSADGRQYARLRNLVVAGLEQAGRPVALVAGVRQDAGPVAANLAAALARAGEDVVLLCADVFGRTSAALLIDTDAPGLAEVLGDQVDLNRALQQVEGIPNLLILGAGRDHDRADALLQTRSAQKLIDQLLDTASYIVIEAPSTTDSPDAQTLAHAAGAALLVVALGQTTSGEVLDASEQFESMGTPVLAAVAAHNWSTNAHDLHPESPTGQQPHEWERAQVPGNDQGGTSSPAAEEPLTGDVHATAASSGAARRPQATPRSSGDVAPR
jgi:Mrp family chromosome partitioning ATPase/capsular polysaccharide biosynthesis protein